MNTKQAVQKTKQLIELLKRKAQGHESSQSKEGARKAKAMRVNAEALEEVLSALREAEYEASRPRNWDYMDL